MSLKSKLFFSLSLIFLLSSSFVAAQTNTTTPAGVGNINVEDINNDGKQDSKDVAILSWLINRHNNREYQPEVKSFTASPSSIAVGESSELQWNIEGEPTEVSIDQGVGDVTQVTSIIVNPTVTTTYTLTATNSMGPTTAQITVQVSPKIVSFTASPATVISGGNSTLRWNIEGSPTEVSIDQEIGVVTGSSIIVHPIMTKTYTLTVVYLGGTVYKQVTVFIKPKIISFTASPATITPDGISTLSWEINGNPTRVSINRDVGDVTGETSVDISVRRTTTFTITASNRYGSNTKTVQVTTKNIPIIRSFTASSTVVTSSGSTLLRWNITSSGTVDVSISKTVGRTTTTVLSSLPKHSNYSRYRQWPDDTTTTYTLTATNSVGTTTATVTVYLLKIKSFTASPSSIVLGAKSELQWDIEDESTEVSINQGVGDVTGLTTISVNPQITTIYTLTATKTDGSTTRTVTKTVKITIHTPPDIASFTASNTIITSDESTLLRWNVTGSGTTTVSLSKTVGRTTTTVLSSLPKNSTYRQWPDTTTTYTLTATNPVGTATATVTVYLLNIKSFTATLSSVVPSKRSSKLEWDIDGEPTKISIDQGVGDVTGKTSTTVTPTATTDYTLTAEKTDGSTTRTVTKTVTITVQTPPDIASFTASNTIIISGESTLLRWNVTGSGTTTVSLSKTVGRTTTTVLSSLPKNSSHRQWPDTTTTYTLTATNSIGTATATVTVYLLNIKSFTATPSSVVLGAKSELQWDIDGEPTKISIDQGVGDVTGKTSTTVTPTATTDYTLTAEKTDGSTIKTVIEMVTVHVEALPTIESFTADPTIVPCDPNCYSTILRWDITGTTTSVSIDQNVGEALSPTGSQTVFPEATTTYTLTATNSSGSVTKTVKVYALKIKEFTANPASITEGNHSVLRWNIDGEPTSISIDPGGDVTGETNTIVTPTVTTDYTLTASKPDGLIPNTVIEMVTVTVTAPSSSIKNSSLKVDIKKNIQDCAGCPQMIVIPKELMQDSLITPEIHNDDEDSEHSFVAIGIKRVTWEQWQDCVEEAVCKNYDFPNMKIKHPVTDISMEDADLYIKWLSHKTEKTYRLLSNQEWTSVINQIASTHSPEDFTLQSSEDHPNEAVSSEDSDDLLLKAGFRVIRDL